MRGVRCGAPEESECVFVQHPPSSLSFIHKHHLLFSISNPFLSFSSSILRCHRYFRLWYSVIKANEQRVHFFVSETRNRITTPPSLKSSFRAHKGMEAIRPVGGQRQNDNFLSNSENSLVNDLPPPPEPFPLHLLSKNASSSTDSIIESDQIVSAWRSLEMIW